MNRRELLFAASALVPAAALCTHVTAAMAATDIQIGLPVDSTNYLAAMLAVSLGYFKDEGIDAKLVSMGGGANMRQAIASRQIPYGIGDVAHPLAMTGAGRKAKVLAVIDARFSAAIIVVRNELWDQGVRTVEDLAAYKKPDGSKPDIGVTRIGSATWTYGNFIMGKLGAADKVNFVSVNDGAPMVGALRSGRLDAAVTNPLTYFAVLDGDFGKTIFNATEKAAWDKYFGSDIASQCLFALDSQITENPQLTQGVVNGVYRGMQYIGKHSPEQLYEAFRKDFLTNVQSQTVIREIALVKPTFDLNGVITEASYKNGSPIWFNENTKIEAQPYAAMVDFSFLENARRKYG